MINTLKLKSNDLLVFATIFGFSQDGINKYTGSLKYLEEATGASRNTVLKSIKKLIELGYIDKTENYINNVKLCSYRHNELGVQKLTKGSAETELGGGAETEPNNTIIYNTINNRETKFKNSLKPFSGTYGSDMLNDFYLYWTEKKPNGKKMLFEMQKTFDVSRRLQRWNKNNYNNKNLKPHQNEQLQKLTTNIREQYPDL